MITVLGVKLGAQARSSWCQSPYYTEVGMSPFASYSHLFCLTQPLSLLRSMLVIFLPAKDADNLSQYKLQAQCHGKQIILSGASPKLALNPVVYWSIRVYADGQSSRKIISLLSQISFNCDCVHSGKGFMCHSSCKSILNTVV